MADYPGLPNWGYGARIDPETVLGLIPGTPQSKQAKSEQAYRQAAGQAMMQNAATGATEQENRNWTELGQLLARMDTMRDPTTQQLPQDLQPIYDQVVSRMGINLPPRGLPPAPGAPGLSGLDDARAGVTGQNMWSNLTNKIGGHWFSNMLSGAMTPKGKGASQGPTSQQTPGKSFGPGQANVLRGSPSFMPFLTSDTGPAQPQVPSRMSQLWEQPIPTMKAGVSNFWNTVYGPGIPADMWTKISQLPLDYLDLVSRTVK